MTDYEEHACREMDVLSRYLSDHNIPYSRGPRYTGCVRREFIEIDGFDIGEKLIVYDDDGNYKWDVVYGTMSYGYEDGLLEGMNDIFKTKDDEVTGWLTAGDIIKLIENDLK